MERRTINIIKTCKHPNNATYKEAIAKYMSKICDYPVEKYTDSQIENILIDAVRDYIDHCDKPSLFIYDMDLCNRNLFSPKTLIDKICVAFALADVRDGDKYVNGLDEFYDDELEEQE